MLNNQPNHIAVIMDGNQRWASKHKVDLKNGYLEGIKKLSEISNYCINNDIKNLSVYTLSSENRNRKSINLIYDLLESNYIGFLNKINKDNKVRVKFIGKKNNLKKNIQFIINYIESKTINNNILHLNLVFNYSVEYEIEHILSKFIKFEKNNSHNLNSDFINKNKYLGKDSDPQILIRTGGFKRLSNFLLLNLSYTEFFFIDTLWPDFTMIELDNIFLEYKKIKKNYGL